MAVIISFAAFEQIQASVVSRASLVPYRPSDHTLLLGEKSANQKITDFGGGCRLGRQETPVACLIREVREELNLSLNLEILRRSAWVLIIQEKNEYLFAQVWFSVNNFSELTENFQPGEILKTVETPYAWLINQTGIVLDSPLAHIVNEIRRFGGFRW
jgi:8-oxo-dGTP pyrophosphatase MutT (NUDIX family)